MTGGLSGTKEATTKPHPFSSALYRQVVTDSYCTSCTSAPNCLLLDVQIPLSVILTRMTTIQATFKYLQLAPTETSNVTVGGFPVIRWAQTANYGYVPNKRMQNVFMAVAIDLGDPTSPFGSVHPRDKQDVGTRLATGAMAVVYNMTEVYYLGMLAQSAKLR